MDLEVRAADLRHELLESGIAVQFGLILFLQQCEERRGVSLYVMTQIQPDGKGLEQEVTEMHEGQ